ncbi:MAG: TfoX/Sxy family protein, partial [Anaeroplasmataceae bacterium]|nr:TfoX/Sxy family protein [Anaeroplasmataceae bacterium]
REKNKMTNLTSMKNIGKEMANKLISVGLETKEKLMEIGSKEAFLKLKKVYPNVCLVHLYTLEGAIQDIEFNQLPKDVKADLKSFKNSI